MSGKFPDFTLELIQPHPPTPLTGGVFAQRKSNTKIVSMT